MRKFLLILNVLTFSLISCGQGTREYSLQNIGLRIEIPTVYLSKDTFPEATFVDANGNDLKETAKLKYLQPDVMKALLIVSSPDQNNTASFNLAIKTQKTGNFEQYYNFTKALQQLMAKQQMKEYDTLSSTLQVGNIDLYKFLTYSIKTKPIQYSGIYLAQVKSYFLVIKVDYADQGFGKNIEKAILESKFK